MDTAVRGAIASAEEFLTTQPRGQQATNAPSEPGAVWTDSIPEGAAGGYWYYPGNDDDL